MVRSTILGATIAWAIAEVLMRRSPALDRTARAIWTIALGLAIVHVVLAFQFVYLWNHEAAVDATTQQTAAMVGWAWRGGIYVNYVFLALWALDTGWWWIAPADRAARSIALESARRALFLFMFVNGAVIFAAGIGRIIGIISTAVVLLAYLAGPPRRPVTR
jgi:hypothetical protein